MRTDSVSATPSESAVDLRTILDDLRTLVLAESPSSDLAAVARSARTVAELIGARLGRHPEIVGVDGVDHVLLRAANPEVLILAHHDTVWPLGTIEQIPYSEAGGVVRGPGCFDMKLGLVQAVNSLAELRRRHGEGIVDRVSLLVTGDEEVGSSTSRTLLEEEAKRCRAVLVLEAAGPGGALKVERKGVSRYRLEVTGRAAHAGLDPETGVNAAIAAAEMILAVAELRDVAAGTTVTPTVVTAGTAPNTVPAQALVDVDVRAATVAEQHRVDQSIRRIGPSDPHATLVIHGGPNRPPMERAMTEELAGLTRRLAGELGQAPPTTMSVGGASDGNFTAALGIRTLDGLGAVGGGAHAPDEHAQIAAILPRTQLLTALLGELLRGSPGPAGVG
ncbi:M20/M25/M40 family metallo-hydrolase [Streptomyces niveus]|uniref:M20/M25/M40 family metallo-hydrolase n=1 Tax=Streptomyces niveus TaxID=193462 RepID=UPI0036D27FA3